MVEKTFQLVSLSISWMQFVYLSLFCNLFFYLIPGESCTQITQHDQMTPNTIHTILLIVWFSFAPWFYRALSFNKLASARQWNIDFWFIEHLMKASIGRAAEVQTCCAFISVVPTQAGSSSMLILISGTHTSMPKPRKYLRCAVKTIKITSDLKLDL